MPSCLSEVVFGSYLVYSPRGSSEVSAKSRDVTYGIKNANAAYVPLIGTRLAIETVEAGSVRILQPFFGPGVTLVPCPRSSLLREGDLWPAAKISESLLAAGLGRESRPCLKRRSPVARSSSAGPGRRPSIEDHLLSMHVERAELFAPARITVVDDVITKGRTLIAAVSLLKEAFPDAEIRAFAVVRTLGRLPEISAILDPCVGSIRYQGGDAVREP